MYISSIIFKCREHFSRAFLWLQQHWQVCQVLCHWFSGLEVTLHHCALPAITFRFSLSLGILLTAENYSLACMVHMKHTIFSHLHLSQQVYIKTSGVKKREEEKETWAEGLLLCSPLHACSYTVPQVLTSSDKEIRKLLLELSLQLCLFLESAALSGQMMITVVWMQFFLSSVAQLNGVLKTQSWPVFFTMTQKHFEWFSWWKWTFCWWMEISTTGILHF